MRCEEVQKELARDAITSRLKEAVRTHIFACPACRSVQLLFERMDETLQQGPVWEPPAGFARRIAAQAPKLAPSPSATVGLFSSGVLHGAILGLLIAAAGYFAQALLFAPLAGWFESDRAAAVLDAYTRLVRLASNGWMANSALVAWTCAALSLYVAGWFTRRALS